MKTQLSFLSELSLQYGIVEGNIEKNNLHQTYLKVGQSMDENNGSIMDHLKKKNE